MKRIIIIICVVICLLCMVACRDVGNENAIGDIEKNGTSGENENSTFKKNKNSTEPLEEILPERIFYGTENVPILMYHTSSESNPGGFDSLYVKPSEFAKQLEYLNENGYTYCTFDDYEDIPYIEKPILITFDDGYLENYIEIFPLLKEYNAKITIFLTLSSIEYNGITIEMIKEMSDSGLVKFESHCMTHNSLSAMSDNFARLDRELGESKIEIEAITGKEVLALAFPAGDYNDTVIEYCKKYYKYSLRKNGGVHNINLSDYEMRRFAINRETSLNTFVSQIEALPN